MARIGYARVSSRDQDIDGPLEKLRVEGCPGEVGSAAAGLRAVLGGAAVQVLNAAEIGREH